MNTEDNYPKIIALNSEKIKQVAFIYLIFSVIMILSTILLKEVIMIFAIIGPILLLLSGYIYYRSDKIIQLEIHSDKLYYNEKKSFGKFKFQDFYSLLITNQLESIYVSEIKDVQLFNSQLYGNQLFLLLKNGSKIQLLLNSTGAELEEIKREIKIIVDKKNTNF